MPKKKIPGHDVAYIRVSTVDQKTHGQLNNCKVSFHKTFTEKASAKDANRPVLQKCLEYLREGDSLHVHSIDRLARNLMDLQKILSDCVERGVSVRFHRENLIFSGGDNPMQMLQLQMMGAFAQFERSLLLERQKEGILAAKRKGKHIGRKPKLSAKEIADLKDRVLQGEEKKALAAEYGISRTTLYGYLR